MESGNWKAEALLGAVVSGVIAVFVWLTFSLGGGAPTGSKAYVLLFDSALGLSVDNAVAVAGVKVGVVDDISVDGRRARVTVLIAPDVVVFADARAAVRGKTLLGEKYVDLDPGHTGLATLAPGSVVENNEPTVEIDQVIRDVSVLVSRLNNITPPLESAIARIDDALKDQDGRALANELVGTLQDVRTLVRETNKVVKTSGDDVRVVLAMARDKGPSLIERLESASSRVDNLLAAVDPKMIEAAASRVGPAAENIDKITGDMKLAMGDVRDAAKRLDGVLQRVDNTLKRLDAVNETAVREFLQVQGVRVNLIPDATVTNRIKKLREESVPLPD
ncbi:MAG: MlaD family protein [Deltaproteobacteria bacterium]|nr:MlaD family protein [Deltaproteobacteria bacterium]